MTVILAFARAFTSVHYGKHTILSNLKKNGKIIRRLRTTRGAVPPALIKKSRHTSTTVRTDCGNQFRFDSRTLRTRRFLKWSPRFASILMRRSCKSQRVNPEPSSDDRHRPEVACWTDIQTLRLGRKFRRIQRSAGILCVALRGSSKRSQASSLIIV